MAALVLAAALAALLIGVAAAQSPPTGDDVPLNTEYTPKGRDGSRAWELLGGVRINREETIPDSVTPATVDFFSVAFLDDNNGLAAGWACSDPDAAYAELDTCPRVPAVYEYGDFSGEGPEWRRAELEGGDQPGFVGAVAWLGDGRALAVGGTGLYPRREVASATDPAGAARAWLLSDGRWTEVGDLPGTMGALTAVAVSTRTGDCAQAVLECGFAGGLRQLWMWRDGEFVEEPYTNETPDRTVDAAQFRFRVRDIRFDPVTNANTRFKAVAVTGGCCSEDPTANQPRLLVYDGAKWTVRLVAFPAPAGSTAETREAVDTQSLPDSYFAILPSYGPLLSISVVASPGGHPPADGVPQPGGRVFHTRYDQSGALAWASTGLQAGGSGGSGADETGNLLSDLTNPNLAPVRLVAGDGDLGNQPDPAIDSYVGDESTGPDGLIDWAVGENTATGEGIAWTTLDSAEFVPSPVTCRPSFASSSGPAGTDRDCQPESAGSVVEKPASRRLFSMGTHRLNAIRFVSASGIGWAAGDRGALLRLGAAAADGGSAATAPTLGSPDPGEFADTSPYDAFRPVTITSEPGRVPPLLSQPLSGPGKPSWVAWGSADPARLVTEPTERISSVAFSRDGSEAWAVGGAGGSGVLALHRYDAERWTRCQIDDVPGQVPADPACAALAPLKDQKVRLTDVTRIPLERDGDPANDDELELIAIGTKRKQDGTDLLTVVRYRDGRWSIDPAPRLTTNELHEVVFVAPDDGWIAGGALDRPVLYHYDGTAWRNCVDARDACGDTSTLLPLTAEAIPRLYLSETGGTLFLGGTRKAQSAGATAATTYPVILRKDPGPDGRWTAAYDPARGNDAAQQGVLTALSVARDGDAITGWAAGRFGKTDRNEFNSIPKDDEARPVTGFDAYLMRLEDNTWRHWRGTGDAVRQYLPRMVFPPQLLALPDQGGAAVLAPTADSPIAAMPLLRFDPSAGRWKPVPTPFNTARTGAPGASRAALSTIELDSGGGLWVAARDVNTSIDPAIPGRPNVANATWYYRLGTETREPVFGEVPHPIREEIRAAAGSADGTLLVATASNIVYRYDRMAGWTSLEIPGWQAGRTVTRRPQARAVAIGPDGKGLVVGEGGRIADVSALGIRLDAAAGKLCETSDAAPPCGTASTLTSAAIAPDGSALAGGEGRALLWRPAGEAFRPIVPPKVSSTATFTSVSMPSAERAYLTSDTGHIFRGDLGAEGWTWALENLAPGGAEVLSVDDGRRMPVNAIAVDAEGRGYAVGSHGLVLQRDGDGDRPWRRLATGYRDNFFTVALPLGGAGGGALIGGQGGTILTLVDGRFRVAQAADPFDPLFSGTGGPGSLGKVAAMALMPGVEPGQVEAWAAVQSQGGREPRPQAMLHYTSHPDEPLLNPRRSVEPLPDAPEPRPGEITFAAFGRTQCVPGSQACAEPTGSNLTADVLTRAIARDITREAKRPGGPAFAVFTGDISESAGRNGWWGPDADTPMDENVMHDRWAELVPPMFEEAGVPLYGALGRNDLSRIRQCPGGISHCADNSDADVARTNLPWRRSMASMPAPWGLGPAPPATGDVAFKGVAGGGTRVEEQTIAVPVDGGQSVTVPAGGANTHYAFDMTSQQTGEVKTRVVVVDTSLRSMNVAEREQQPVEPGGQSVWLESMLCKVGDQVTGAVTPCSRPPDVPAVVITNTPTYSYGPGTATDTQTDAAAFETILFRHGVSAVVSGRLGWNARYFATAPGVHEPCPGGEYQEDVPEPGARLCGRGEGDVPEEVDETAAQVASTLTSLGAPPPPPVENPLVEGIGVIPFAIAGGGGGPFADPAGTASDGYWHGYTVVRVDASGDPRATIVEQRPVFDWIGIEAGKHVLRSGQKMTLRGFGREPVGLDQPMRYDAIDSPAITHRYDLVKADPKRPYLPARDADGDYVPLPPSIATIEQDGKITTGKGNQERTFAIAILSVKDKAASYPIVFEPRRSFQPKPQVLLPAPQPPRIPASRPLPAPIVLGTAPASLPPQAPPPSSPPPVSINVQAPSPPSLPGPGPTTGATLAPPPPPAPPAPPGSAPPSALTLSLGATGINVGSQSSVIPPPAPPIQPAPPGGARKEARQRQAAAAKSEEGGGGESSESGSSEGGGSNAYTRHEFTALRRSENGSVLGRGALYGGSMTLAALLLSLTWTAARPRDRRREPELPAPAYVRRDRF